MRQAGREEYKFGSKIYRVINCDTVKVRGSSVRGYQIGRKMRLFRRLQDIRKCYNIKKKNNGRRENK